ncbi:PilZ domain-containing protein [Chondromyces crocatus]|uniref:PilZ domain-containing protein n=1 Tax=Chondromyces crocatus TaxID=52 RepID=A0A0K1ECG0_CHOCO|nr:PilZ domain-containing protein [Chondromyces crocatus]AKT38544.1 uncharacterized protein CMC5_026910 [Chondromyces crocatus]
MVRDGNPGGETSRPRAGAPPVWEEIDGSERTTAILTALSLLNPHGILHRGERRVRVALERVDEGGLWGFRLADSEACWGEPPYEISLMGYDSVYHLRIDTRAVERAWLVTEAPGRLVRTRQRTYRRAQAPRGLRARFQSTRVEGPALGEAEVVDVSHGGLSLRVEATERLFTGMSLALTVRLEQGHSVALEGEVRHVSAGREDGRRLCGVKVQMRSAAEGARWREVVGRALVPTTRTRESHLESLWDLYAISGYLNLANKTSAQFEAQRQSFLALGRRTATMDHLSSHTVWPSARGLEASVSTLKIYERAWLMHQLGRRPGTPSEVRLLQGQILRDTYRRALEDIQADPGQRWVLCYGEATVPWVQRTHVQFAQRNASRHEGEVLMMPVRLMEAQCDEPSGSPGEGLTLLPASRHELDRIAQEIARVRPRPFVEALDFMPERLDMKGTSALWHSAGLTRERQCFVARREGVPLAALVVELASPGANLFRLLDSARLFSLMPGGREAFVPLLDEARRWFARRGRSTFVYLCEDDGSSVRAARLHDAPSTQPFLWIIASSILPEFLEHIDEQSVGRPRSPIPSPPLHHVIDTQPEEQIR